jgi:hypothetical protein
MKLRLLQPNCVFIELYFPKVRIYCKLIALTKMVYPILNEELWMSSFKNITKF